MRQDSQPFILRVEPLKWQVPTLFFILVALLLTLGTHVFLAYGLVARSLEGVAGIFLLLASLEVAYGRRGRIEVKGGVLTIVNAVKAHRCDLHSVARLRVSKDTSFLGIERSLRLILENEDRSIWITLPRPMTGSPERFKPLLSALGLPLVFSKSVSVEEAKKVRAE